MPLNLEDLKTDALNALCSQTLPGMVYVLANPNLPHLRFEWHPQTKRVYMIRLDVPDGERLVGDPIADGVPDHGMAWNFMLVWCRGYRERDREIDRGRLLDDVHNWS